MTSDLSPWQAIHDIYEDRCSQISFWSTVARSRSFHVNNKSVGYTRPWVELQLVCGRWLTDWHHLDEDVEADHQRHEGGRRACDDGRHQGGPRFRVDLREEPAREDDANTACESPTRTGWWVVAQQHPPNAKRSAQAISQQNYYLMTDVEDSQGCHRLLWVYRLWHDVVFRPLFPSNFVYGITRRLVLSPVQSFCCVSFEGDRQLEALIQSDAVIALPLARAGKIQAFAK